MTEFQVRHCYALFNIWDILFERALIIWENIEQHKIDFSSDIFCERSLIIILAYNILQSFLKTYKIEY